MGTDLPLASSLDAAALADRGTQLARLRARADELRRRAGGRRVSWSDAEGLEAELRALADAEARCCPFLTLAVVREAGRLHLDVSGPPDAAPLIAAMFPGPAAA